MSTVIFSGNQIIQLWISWKRFSLICVLCSIFFKCFSVFKLDKRMNSICPYNFRAQFSVLFCYLFSLITWKCSWALRFYLFPSLETFLNLTVYFQPTLEGCSWTETTPDFSNDRLVCLRCTQVVAVIEDK